MFRNTRVLHVQQLQSDVSSLAALPGPKTDYSQIDTDSKQYPTVRQTWSTHHIQHLSVRLAIMCHDMTTIHTKDVTPKTVDGDNPGDNVNSTEVIDNIHTIEMKGDKPYGPR